MRTLTLDLKTWDICLDSAGQIRVSSGPYGIAQNVANAGRLFTDDAYYDPERGIPHFQTSLTARPDMAVVRARLRKAALTVEGVREAEVEIFGIDDRVLTGNIQLTLVTGETVNVAL